MTDIGQARIELRRDEARDRAAAVNGVSYEVAVDLTGEGDEFGTCTTATFSAVPGSATFIEFAGTIEEADLNGESVPPGFVDANRIRLAALRERNVVRSAGRGRYQRDGTGLHRFVDVDGEAYLHTKFQPYDAQRVYACFDQPDLKARLVLSVRVPAHWVVVANSPAVIVEPDGAGRSWWRFEPTQPLPTYLTALVAGPFASVGRRHGDLGLRLYARPNRLTDLERDADELFDVTAAGLDWYSRQFGRPYPFGPRYHQAFVPEYGFGAMEHPGCVTFSERFVFRGRMTGEARRRRSEVVLHEMAHMWFGNLVTMRWWDDLWLNEAFATLLSTMAQDGATAIGSAAWQVWLHDVPPRAREADQLPSTHPVSADVADTASVRQQFDPITYRKGAAVLAQLMDDVGDDNFLMASRRYFNDHEWGNAERTDFLSALGAVGFADPMSWSADWLERAGLGAVRAVGPQPKASADAGPIAEQDLPSPATDPRPWRLEQVGCPPVPHLRDQTIEVAWYEQDPKGLVNRGLERVRLASGQAGLCGPFQPGGGRILAIPNPRGRAYVKTLLDDASTTLLIDRAADLTDPLARAVCWGALWDTVWDGRLAPGRFVAAVIDHVRSETVVGVIEQLVERAVAAATVLAADPARGAAVTDLAQAARGWLEEAEGGGDLQLCWVRLLARVARSKPDIDLLEGLLSGHTALLGLEVDTELRWRLVVSLAAAGRLEDTDIAKAEAADSTDEGRRWGWTARAARPDAGAKTAALSEITNPSLSLAERRAAMDGWQRADQRELLSPFVNRYSEMAARTWEEGEEAGIAFARTMYPHHTTDDDAVLAATAALLSEEIPAGLRRIVKDERARLGRYRSARSLDAETPGVTQRGEP